MNSQRGFSLIESLVALTIGVVLTWGLTNYFTQSKNTQVRQQAMVTQFQHERAITSVLNRGIRHAGFMPAFERVVNGRNAGFGNVGSFAAGQILLGIQANDSVTVRKLTDPQVYPDDRIEVRFVGDGVLRRCDGSIAPVGVVSTDSLYSDNGQLMCQGAITTPLMGLAVGPEDNQFRVLGLNIEYGEDTNLDELPDLEVRANGVTSWNSVYTASVDVHYQVGQQLPQSIGVVVPLENVLGVGIP